MIKVSIIIPVYNVENYLRKCLDSIINQTLKEIEIICIDDCSTDNSYSILEEYSKIDSRIIIIKNDVNKGSGNTRNVGIEKAKGEYIGFIDSDDFINDIYFEELYNTAKKFNADLTNTQNIIIYENGNIIKYDNYKNYKIGLRKHNIGDIIEHIRIEKELDYPIYYSSCGKLWKREFLNKNNIRFFSISNSEDFYLFFTALAYNPIMSYNGKAEYYYVQRSDSLIRAGVREDTSKLAYDLFPYLIEHYHTHALEYESNIKNFLFNYLFFYFVNSYSKDIFNYFKELFMHIYRDNNCKPTNLFLKFYYNNALKKLKSFQFYNKLYTSCFRKIFSHKVLILLKKLDILP